MGPWAFCVGFAALKTCRGLALGGESPKAGRHPCISGFQEYLIIPETPHLSRPYIPGTKHSAWILSQVAGRINKYSNQVCTSQGNIFIFHHQLGGAFPPPVQKVVPSVGGAENCMGLLIPIPPPLAWISLGSTHEATSQPEMVRRGRHGFGA